MQACSASAAQDLEQLLRGSVAPSASIVAGIVPLPLCETSCRDAWQQQPPCC